MPASELTYEEQLIRLRKQNSDRQRRFYSANSENLKAKRREKYKEKRDAYKLAHGIPIDEPPVEEEQPATKRGKKGVPVAVPVATKGKRGKKVVEPPVPVKAFTTLDDILVQLSESQTKNYANHYKTIFAILKTKDYQATITSNPVKTIEAINNANKGNGKPYSVNSKKAYIQAILVSFDLGMPDPQKTKLLYFNDFQKSKLDSNAILEHKKATETVIPYADYLNRVETHFGNKSEEFLMASLYNEMPVRDDFQLLLVKSLKEAKDDELQYIAIPTKQTEPITILINKYKTEKKYGPIKKTLSIGLSQQIRAYIALHKITYGAFLFGKRTSNSGFIGTMNKKIGVDGRINTIRQMHSSQFVLTSDERVSLADEMKHSPMMSLNYIRNLSKA